MTENENYWYPAPESWEIVEQDFGAPSAESLLDGLNPAQYKAVVSDADALLIVAGAGSGKTRVLTHRIAYLLQTRKLWASQILAITFTNKAAAEMRERLGYLIGKEARSLWVKTFHSACVQILRAEAHHLGYGTGFSIYDTNDSRALLKTIIASHEAESYGFKPAGLAARISKLKSELVSASDYLTNANSNNPADRLFAQMYHAYQQELRQLRAFDFDDLIGETVYLFRAFPQIAAKYQARFRHILVDEYQDTNPAQYMLIRELTKPISAELVRGLGRKVYEKNLLPDGGLPAAKITVVGDSDQSIYAFRGADIRNIVEFERDFPGAEVVKLEQNYRSTQTILSAANAVISCNTDRQEKSLWTDFGDGEKIVGFAGFSAYDEARFVADEIGTLADKGMRYDDIAVFYRTNAQSRALEDNLIRNAIPYRIFGGAKFYDRAEIKDAIAYLTVLLNPYDQVAWARALQSPKRGIGNVSLGKIVLFAQAENISLIDAMLRAESAGLSGKVLNEVKLLGKMLSRLRESVLREPATRVSELLEAIYEETNWLNILRSKKDPQEQARAENLEELVAYASDFQPADENEPLLLAFLTEVSLLSAVDDLENGNGAVSLMTVHSAKGLEFPVVFLTGLEESIFPSRLSFDEPGGIAEERRLMYVGITRARQKLYISLAASRTQYNQTNTNPPSRFISEIPADLIDWRQQVEEVMGVSSGGYELGSGVTTYSEKASGQAGKAMQNALDVWRERKKAIEASARFGDMINVGSDKGADFSLSVGDFAEHDSYGVGKVIAVTGEGAKEIAHIDFPDHGLKKMLVRLAPIKKVER